MPARYPRIEFFQSNQLRNLMVDILFIYAKLNPDVSYRQVPCITGRGNVTFVYQYVDRKYTGDWLFLDKIIRRFNVPRQFSRTKMVCSSFQTMPSLGECYDYRACEACRVFVLNLIVEIIIEIESCVLACLIHTA